MKSSLAAIVFLIASATFAYAAGGGHDTEHALQLLVFAWINFGTFVALAFWKLRGPVRQYMQNRYDSIRHEIDRVVNQRSALQEQLKTAQNRLANAEAEAAQLLADSEAAAKRQAEKMIEAANSQAEQQKRSAAQQAAALEREAQAEVVAAAAKLLTASAGDKLDKQASAQQNANYSNKNLAILGVGA